MQRILFVHEPTAAGEWSCFWLMAKLSRRSRNEKFLFENILKSLRFYQRLLPRLQFSFFGFWTAWWLNVSTFRKDVLPFFSGQLNCLIWMLQ